MAHLKCVFAGRGPDRDGKAHPKMAVLAAVLHTNGPFPGSAYRCGPEPTLLHLRVRNRLAPEVPGPPKARRTPPPTLDAASNSQLLREQLGFETRIGMQQVDVLIVESRERPTKTDKPAATSSEGRCQRTMNQRVWYWLCLSVNFGKAQDVKICRHHERRVTSRGRPLSEMRPQCALSPVSSRCLNGPGCRVAPETVPRSHSIAGSCWARGETRRTYVPPFLHCLRINIDASNGTTIRDGSHRALPSMSMTGERTEAWLDSYR
jgi:hypothetical protein